MMKLMMSRDRVCLYPRYFADECLTKEMARHFGTQILKDRELVEVDADNGVVRIAR